MADPPEYDPDDAEAQRIAEEYADAAAEMWAEQRYQPGVTDPATTSEGTPQ